MSGDLFDDPGEFVPPLLRAIHRGCGRTVGTYSHGNGWTRSGGRCHCTPSPGLPEGAALKRELAAARLGRTRSVKV